MKRTPIDVFEYASQILEPLPRGILLNTAAGGKMDTMTIGWGSLGEDWGKKVFTVLVRESRYTKNLIEKNPEFTLSIPVKGSDVKSIIALCGTKSGRDIDKFEACNLTVVPGHEVSTPAIAELPLTIECKIIYKQDQDPEAIQERFKSGYYPNGDWHTAYTGEIVAAYLLEEDED